MSAPSVLVPAVTSDTRLRGRLLLIARSMWGVVALIDLGVLMVGFPAYAAQL